MLVAKFPGSTYATEATNAGPRKGRSARRPRVWPLSAFSAARSTRSSPGRAATAACTLSALTALTGGFSITLRGAVSGKALTPLDEHGPGQPEWNTESLALDADLDRTLVFARRQHLDVRAGKKTAAVELAQLGGIVVRDALDDHLLARAALMQRALARRPHLAGDARDGVAVRVELRAAEQLEDSLLHPLRDHMLEALRLLVNLVPAVAEHPDEEHLQEPVVPDQLEGHLPALARQLLTAVPVVLDQALCLQPRDHLADGRRGDAETLGQLAGGDGAAVPMEVVQRLEVVLLGLGEGAAPGDFDHGAALGRPNYWLGYTYHKV